jgi:hypothetical protein
MPKLKVRPTAAGARILKALLNDEQLAISEILHERWWHETGWRKSFEAEKQYGKPRVSTIKKCREEGWLKERGSEYYKSLQVLSEEGQKVAEDLTDEDLISRVKGYSSRDIIRALRKRHPFPEWIFAEEVRLGTGFTTSYHVQGSPRAISGEGRIDALVMNTYPYKRFIRIAYEIKISRADFLSEMKNPYKREGAEMFANACYFAAPAGLIKPDELPEPWGLVEINGDFHRMKVKAPTREAADLMPPFVASLCRSLIKHS